MDGVLLLKWPSKNTLSFPWYMRLLRPLFIDSCNEQVFDTIAKQLETRSSLSLSKWESFTSIEKNAAKKIAETLKSHLGWPNTYFVPNDPAEIVFWDKYGDLDLVEAILEIEKRFDIKANDKYWQTIDNKTFGGVVKDIINKKI